LGGEDHQVFVVFVVFVVGRFVVQVVQLDRPLRSPPNDF